MKPIIKIENLSKQYRLGTVGTGTIKKDLQRWWAQVQGKDDPFLKIGDTNDRSVKGKSEFVWALRDINLEVMPGEVLGIIGKNGAGKSTLLKILSKVTGPTTGKIHFNGRIGSLLEVGTGFHKELTGRENIYLNGAILGMNKKEIRGKIDEIIDFSGCERYIDTPVKRYSSGMTVRLGFAVAAHLEPEILVVDEVLAVGDAEFQKKAIGKMQDVSSNDGRTVLFVSHNMASIENLCSRAILMQNGEIIKDDKVSDTINHYLENNSVRSDWNISERKDRKGNGVVQLTKVELKDYHTNQRISETKTGQAAVIEMSLKCSQPIIKNLTVGIAVFNRYDKPITVFNSTIANNKFLNYSKDSVLRCVIPKIPLVSGIYNLKFTIIANQELSDQIENAFELIVNDGDFYNSGKLITNAKHDFYTEHEWKIL